MSGNTDHRSIPSESRLKRLESGPSSPNQPLERRRVSARLRDSGSCTVSPVALETSPHSDRRAFSKPFNRRSTSSVASPLVEETPSVATSRTRAVLGEHSSDVLLYHSPGSSGTVRVSRDPSQPSTRLSEGRAARSRSRATGSPRLGGWWCQGAGPQGPAPAALSSARPRSHGGRFARATGSIEALLARHGQGPSGFWWQLFTPALGRTGQPVWSRAGGCATSVACCDRRLVSKGAVSSRVELWRRFCSQRVEILVAHAHRSCLAGIPKARCASKRSVLPYGGVGRETTWLVEGTADRLAGWHP